MDRIDIGLSLEQVRAMKNGDEVLVRGGDGKTYALNMVRKRSRIRSRRHIEEVTMDSMPCQP